MERSPDWEWARNLKNWAAWILEGNFEEARRFESSPGTKVC